MKEFPQPSLFRIESTEFYHKEPKDISRALKTGVGGGGCKFNCWDLTGRF